MVLDTPAVIAHGRLLLLGGDNQRLHEELITAGGYLRQGRFARMNVGQVQQGIKVCVDSKPPIVTPKGGPDVAVSGDSPLYEGTYDVQVFLNGRFQSEQEFTVEG